MKNYRGVTLIDTAYKIYASVLNKRMKKQVEGKFEEEQFGFRTGKSTVDAIYIMNHAINRSVMKEKGKLFAFFATLKAAFDKVDRIKLGEMLKKQV